jgi:hypothetical protein|tara:strand:- start:1376 stop:1543 length:168 start_codon:yes stop_codon:yes gene_type:complete
MEEGQVVACVAEPIVQEFRLALKGLRDSIEAIPEEEWHLADRKHEARLLERGSTG